eukprot:UN32091
MGGGLDSEDENEQENSILNENEKRLSQIGLALLIPALLMQNNEQSTAFFMRQLISLLQKNTNIPTHKIKDLLHLVIHCCKSRRFKNEWESSLHRLDYQFTTFEGAVKLTSQQHQIVLTELGTKKTKTSKNKKQQYEIIRINAFAGTGKTTCLLAYARARPWLKFLYVSFNASISAEASKSFPPNVRCSNIHKLAYRYIGWKYTAKLKVSSNKFNKDFGGVVCQRLVFNTVENFLRSSDREIQTSHFTPKAEVWIVKQPKRKRRDTQNRHSEIYVLFIGNV